ncbi:prepilin-type N-terminal cleavage/methylation domain-containing protein [Leptolyngbya sp. FACHB-16]|uniref:pilus assembly FimT family protein n=1 Tax=unclassified Leptolyngbya TaxID=2650499 RepID=UPI001684AFA7|nr:prepilin-type N-terminal cleavage/methylation domain-containing protein [Leptolyngbya sp. FACHB-16]MBD2158138.1 type II secretion system protein [Leptolyngbya sp. FACHB-16]
MWRFYVREPNKGFTLIELLVVIGLLGILSAISSPVFVGMYARTRVNAALADIQTALLEGQRQAIRTSRACDLTLNSSTRSLSGSCLVGGDRALTRVTLRTSTSAVRFDFKGVMLNPSNNATSSQAVTVVVASPNTNLQRCLVVSAPLGLTRTGTYTGNGTTDTSCLP